MKKMNKKGFTLIELLAVIIILGILMIIAIPSVTQYIQNSRKDALVTTAGKYIDAVVTKVTEAKKLKFFDENTLYLVPVGHEDGKTCSALEKGGESPFNSTWKYAYVGVVYKGDSYDYYFMGKDGSNQGIKFTKQDKIDEESVISGMPKLLDSKYGKKDGNEVYCVSGTECTLWSSVAGDDNTKIELPTGVTQVILVDSNCQYEFVDTDEGV